MSCNCNTCLYSYGSVVSCMEMEGDKALFPYVYKDFNFNLYCYIIYNACNRFTTMKKLEAWILGIIGYILFAGVFVVLGFLLITRIIRPYTNGEFKEENK